MSIDEAPKDPPRPRDRKRTLAVAAAPALAVLAASFVQTEIVHRSWDRLNAIFAVWSPARSSTLDVLPALRAARTLLQTPHGAIYDMSHPERTAFLYPPIAAAMYAPHVREGEGTWSLLLWNRLVYLVVALLVGAALIGPRRRSITWLEVAGVVAAMLLFLPMVRSLELNQASLYVAAFVGAAWVALDRGAERAAGVFLALAAALKPHLFAMVPLLVFHARRTAIAAALAGVALGAASIAYAGVENHVTYLTHVLPEAARGYAYFPNQSFGGMFHRLLSDGPIDSFRLMAPSSAVMRAALATGAALYLAAFAVVHRARNRPELRLEALALAWLVTTMIAPIAWGHHYAAALFPLAWLVGRARDGAERGPMRLAVVATGCALVGSYFVVGGLRGVGPRLLASYGLLGALLAAGAFAATLLRAGAPARDARDTPDPASLPASLEWEQHRAVAGGGLAEQAIAPQHEHHLSGG